MIVAAAAAFLTPFMGSALNVALPQMGKELALDALDLSWVVTAYLLATVVLLVPLGRLADIVGRKKVFNAGLLVFSGSAALVALVTSGPILLGLRALQGLGGAMIMGTGVALLTSVFPPQERGRVLGINVSAVYLGLSAGPFVGGVITDHLGWHAIFWLCAGLGLAAAALTAWHLRGEWAEAKGERFDGVGAVVFGVAMVALIDGFSLLPASAGLWLVGSGALGLALFACWEVRSPHPVLDIKLFVGNPVFAFSNLAALINYCATSAVGFLLSLYLQTVKGFTPQTAGLVLVAQPVVMMLVSPLAGRLSDRVEPRVVASLGMGSTVVGLLLLAQIDRATSVGALVALLVVLGLGFGLFSSPNTNAVMSAVEKRHYGVAAATVSTMRLTGQMLSMGVAMLLLALYVGPVSLGPAVTPQLIGVVRVASLIFAGLCVVGVGASLARGTVHAAKS